LSDLFGNLVLHVLRELQMHDWKVEMISSFFELYSQRVRQGDEDNIYWIPSRRKMFEVKSYYHEYINFSELSIFLEEYLENQGSTLEKILTLDNLQKMNVIVVDWYCMCKKSGESIDHLFLRCEIARELWSSIFYLFGYASNSEKVVGELKRTTWTPYCFRNVGIGSIVFNVMYLERKT
jgi:hypothetical protein